MNWIVSTSLRLRVLVLALSIVLLIVGIRMARRAPLDVFPEFAPPLVEVQTEAPGLSTEEVESLVSVPLENALNGTIGLKTIRSKSVLGLSQVVLILKEGTDLMAARQVVQERLSTEAPRLPAAARHPVILSPLSSTSRLLKIGVSSKTLSQMEMTQLAKWTIRPRLMAIPGVANVAIWGQRDTQYQVLVDPDRLRANAVTLDTVVRAVTDTSAVAAGGFVDMPNQRIAVRHRSPIETPEDLARTTVAIRNGVPLKLGDVAEVKIGLPAPIGDAVINDGPGLLLIVEKQPTGNTLEVTRNVEKALEDLKPGLKGLDIDPTIFRPATFIERSLDNLKEAMIVGCALVVIILVSFLYDWRTALISLTAIPLSLIAALDRPDQDGGDDQHDGPGGPGDRDGRGRRRRDHRRREHRPPAPPEPGVAPAALALPGGALGLARSPQRRGVRQPDRDPGVHPGLLPRRALRLVLPAAGPGLRAGDRGVAAGRPDGDPRPVADAPDRGKTERRHESPLVRGSRRSTARSCRRSRGGRGGRSVSWRSRSRPRARSCRAGRGVHARTSRRTTS